MGGADVMAWGGVLEQVPSFGETLARNIGQGFGKGAESALDLVGKAMLEKMKIKKRQDLINSVEGIQPKDTSKNLTSNQPFTDEQAQKFNDLAQKSEQQGGDYLSPKELDTLWEIQNQKPAPSVKTEDPFRKAKLYAAAGEHELSKVETERAKLEEKKKTSEKEIYGEQARGFWKNIAEDSDKLPLMKSSLEAQMNAVLSGEVDPFSRGHFADIAKGLGAPSALVASFETPGSKSFKTGLKTYLSSTIKEAFRGTTTGREIDLAESLLAQAGVSREGNLASIWLLQSQLMLKEKRIEIASELKRKGISGYEIPELVSDQLEPFRKQLSQQYFEALKSFSKEEK